MSETSAGAPTTSPGNPHLIGEHINTMRQSYSYRSKWGTNALVGKPYEYRTLGDNFEADGTELISFLESIGLRLVPNDTPAQWGLAHNDIELMVQTCVNARLQQLGSDDFHDRLQDQHNTFMERFSALTDRMDNTLNIISRNNRSLRELIADTNNRIDTHAAAISTLDQRVHAIEEPNG